jgi:hypothetical protein
MTKLRVHSFTISIDGFAAGPDRAGTDDPSGPAVSGMHRRGMDTHVGRRIAQEQRRAAQLASSASPSYASSSASEPTSRNPLWM